MIGNGRKRHGDGDGQHCSERLDHDRPPRSLGSGESCDRCGSGRRHRFGHAGSASTGIVVLWTSTTTRHPPVLLAELARRVLGLLGGNSRIIVGIAGSPGAGKTTLAKQLVDRLNDDGSRAVYLPMDGFHLANATLDRLGIHERKGAIDTFDGWGFVALLNRVLAEQDHTVYAPSFERTVDEGIAGEVAIAGRHPRS